MRRLRKHTGFTATEILLSFAMLALLLMLFLPALQISRRTARRAQCLNNLRQIGTALQNYETVMNVLPPGCVNPDGPILNEPMGYHMSWIAQSLSMMDRGRLFDELDWTYGAYSNNATMAAFFVLPTLQCASDPALPNTAASSYAGCIGGTSQMIDDDNTGLLFLNSSINDNQVPDGRSYTLLVGEIQISSMLTENGMGWSSGTAATLRSSGLSLNSTHDSMYEVITAEAGGFGSWHDGVVTMLFADGAVKSLSTETDVDLLKRLGDRSDGQMVEIQDNVVDRRVRNMQHRQATKLPELSP